MDASRWAPTYDAILRDLGYDRAADEAARDLLDALLAEARPADLPALAERLRGREAFVIGAAATRRDVERVPDGAPLLASDAAAGVVLDVRTPDAIVTDLDGDVARQAEANAAGVPLVVHAHGDNVDALRAWLPRLPGPVVGTTQAEPRGRVRCFGGFTDGDRACCLAVELGSSSLALVGFDFERPAPKPGLDVATKRRKLAWARRIVEGLGVPTRVA